MPLIGIALMEGGAFGINVGRFGHPNGATLAYGLHAVILLATLGASRWLLKRVVPISSQSTDGTPAFLPWSYRRLAATSATLILTYVVLELFALGAIDVLRGQINKGQFRSTLGGFGVLAYMLRDYVIPALAAMVAFVYRHSRREPLDRGLLGLVVLLAGASTAVWGYKAGAILTMLPALIVLYDRPRLHHVVALGVAGLAALTGFAVLFDQVPPSTALVYVMARATVGAGDSAWMMWDMHVTHSQMPPYPLTLVSAVGGRVGSALGLFARGDQEALLRVDFASVLTNVVKGFHAGVNVLISNVTGTVFSEGVWALGAPGYLLMAAAAGVVSAIVWRALEWARAEQRVLAVSLVAVYGMTSLFSWLNTGGVTTLLSLPGAVNYAITYGVCRILMIWAAVPLRIVAPTMARRATVSFVPRHLEEEPG